MTIGKAKTGLHAVAPVIVAVAREMDIVAARHALHYGFESGLIPYQGLSLGNQRSQRLALNTGKGKIFCWINDGDRAFALTLRLSQATLADRATEDARAVADRPVIQEVSLLPIDRSGRPRAAAARRNRLGV